MRRIEVTWNKERGRAVNIDEGRDLVFGMVIRSSLHIRSLSTYGGRYWFRLIKAWLRI